MKKHLPWVAGLASAVLALSACSGDEEPADPDETADVEETPDEETEEADPEDLELDLEAAGGICALVDPDALQEATEVEFTSASGFFDADDDTGSCAIQTNIGTFPDLTIGMSATDVSAEVFEDEWPSDADELEDVGEAAYEMYMSESESAGPTLVIGWLSDDHAFEMQYTSAEGTEIEDLEESAGGLADLASSIDAAWEDFEPQEEDLNEEE